MEAMIHMPKGANIVKGLLSHKEKLEKHDGSSSSRYATNAQRARDYKTVFDKENADVGPSLDSNKLTELSMRVKNEIVTFNIKKSMKSKYSRNAYLYCADHTAKLVLEQWVDTVDHDRKLVEAEKGDSNEVREVSFYPRPEPVEPLEWKALEKILKPSSVEPPKLELKELPKHLKYAFLQENNQLPVVISFALSATEKARLLEVLRDYKGAIT
nr:hypothetical protein [Tanacetum cinerariifolium]